MYAHIILWNFWYSADGTVWEDQMKLSHKARVAHGLLRARHKHGSWLQNLIECVPIETVVAHLTHLEPSEGPYAEALCRFHGEKTASLVVAKTSEGKVYVHCFGCGVHAKNSFDLLGCLLNSEHRRWSTEKRVSYLATLAGVEVRPTIKKRRYPRTRRGVKRKTTGRPTT